MATIEQLAEQIRAEAHSLTGAPEDYDPLLESIGDARFVLLGEASHGTREFYHHRAEITKKLILEKGFTAVAVEADWPDAYRVNTYVRGLGEDTQGAEALADFERFPSWMWRNSVVRDFVAWLRAHNETLTSPLTEGVGFYGLDLYSLFDSMEVVLNYLKTVDPEAAQRARRRYGCFDHFAEDTQAYGLAAALDLSRSCEDEALRQLLELQRRAADYSQRDGVIAEDRFFHAEQNARLVRNAEEYYRSMFGGRAESWNLRDTHMVDTLDALDRHLGRHGDLPKIVVWAHNSHLGDARATEMSSRGELNVGQLVRQRHDGEAFLVGFTTYTGTVTAASDWDEPAERKWVRPGLEDSYEALFHHVGIPDFLLDLRSRNAATTGLREDRLERAIGVIYRPETERWSHYFSAALPRQFDAVLHFDRTRALEPLEREQLWEKGATGDEPPETFPSGV